MESDFRGRNENREARRAVQTLPYQPYLHTLGIITEQQLFSGCHFRLNTKMIFDSGLGWVKERGMQMRLAGLTSTTEAQLSLSMRTYARAYRIQRLIWQTKGQLTEMV